MKKAFISGGSGHVGSNLVRKLLDQGWHVRCLIHKDIRGLEGLDVELVNGDLLDCNFLAQQMQGCYAVFHVAANVAVENIDIELMEKINIDGTKAMCSAALKTNIDHFIHFSSIHAFEQKPLFEILNEERPLVNESSSAPYDRTKARAELVVKKAYNQGLKTIIINPTGIIGPYDYKPSRMGQVILNIMNQKMLFTINAGFNWVDVRDVCDAAIKSVEAGEYGQSYIVPGRWASFEELADIISDIIGKNTRWITLPFWVAYCFLPFAYLSAKLSGKRPSFSKGSLHALAVQSKKVSLDRAKNKLNYQPRPLEETLKDTIHWINNHVN